MVPWSAWEGGGGISLISHPSLSEILSFSKTFLLLLPLSLSRDILSLPFSSLSHLPSFPPLSSPNFLSSHLHCIHPHIVQGETKIKNTVIESNNPPGYMTSTGGFNQVHTSAAELTWDSGDTLIEAETPPPAPPSPPPPPPFFLPPPPTSPFPHTLTDNPVRCTLPCVPPHSLSSASEGPPHSPPSEKT